MFVATVGMFWVAPGDRPSGPHLSRDLRNIAPPHFRASSRSVCCSITCDSLRHIGNNLHHRIAWRGRRAPCCSILATTCTTALQRRAHSISMPSLGRSRQLSYPCLYHTCQHAPYSVCFSYLAQKQVNVLILWFFNSDYFQF